MTFDPLPDLDNANVGTLGQSCISEEVTKSAASFFIRPLVSAE